MQYMGGKGRIGRAIAQHILAERSERLDYYEPFVGAGWVLQHMAPHFANVHAGEIQPDLVCLWQALREGWDPPATLSREEYAALRSAEPSALRAFAGFGASFGGKWFGGYASNARGDDFVGAARRGLIAKRDRIGDVPVKAADYREWSPGPDAVVYCDPPYAGTTEYDGADPFDSTEFWRHMVKWAAAGAAVYVSEYTAPDGVAEISWERTASTSLRKDDNRGRATERLYRVHG